MTTAIIVQARFGSSRLPGKVLMPLGTAPALASVLGRCARVPGVDVVVCAVPDDRASDPVADAALDCGAVVCRGSEHDVLARYHQAARMVGASIVMRVTSDCPLVDPVVCGEVLKALVDYDADYACNNMPPLWPHGLDCEAFWGEHLAWAAREATAPHDREHVTPWLRRHGDLRRVNIDGPGRGLERHRWTLDYPEDYFFFRALWDALGSKAETADMRDCLAALDAHPEIRALNGGLIDEARLQDRSFVASLRVTNARLVPV